MNIWYKGFLTIAFFNLCFKQPSRFGSVVAQPDLDGEVSGSSPGHTKDFKNGTYCSSACACHNELRHKKEQLISYTMDLQTKVV